MSFVLDAMEQLDAPPSDEQEDPVPSAPPVQGQQPVVQQTQPTTVQPPVAQPPVAPQAQQPPVQQQAPVVQPQAVPGQPPTQQVAPQDGLRNLANEMERQRENFVSAAAQSYESTFTDDDIAEFQGEPAQAKKALSKMAARLHADIVQNTFSVMSQHLPVMMQGMIEAQAVQRTAADSFWSQNPDLKAHEAQIAPMAKALRQANPQMDTQTYMQQLAAWARTSLQLAPPAARQQQQTPPPRRPAAFQPAPTGGPRNGAVQPQADNPWSRVDQIMDADNRGVLDTAR